MHVDTFVYHNCTKLFTGCGTQILEKWGILPYVDLFTRRSFATEATFHLKEFILFNLKKSPEISAKLTRDEVLLYYKQMKEIREIEVAAGKLYRKKAIRGFCHLYPGQEACAVGMKAAMRSNDKVITAYRCHGIAYVMGLSIDSIICELTGKVSGCSRGKGGSMHMYGPGFYGGNGIVGAQVPLGTGIAFAIKYNKEDAVCFTMYGDGASNQGQVFESFNLAKLWNLPCIFVCENNQYGMGTSKDRSSANTKYFTRGDYIPGLWVNGMGVLEVREACRYAIQHVKEENGPLILEFETYRYQGHSMSDPGISYRSREEVQRVRESQDPIINFKQMIVESQLVTDDELKAIDTEIKEKIKNAVKKSKEDPEPDLVELAGDVYSMPLEKEIRGRHPWQYFEHKLIGKPVNI